jgi:hypothetical protein
VVKYKTKVREKNIWGFRQMQQVENGTDFAVKNFDTFVAVVK